MTHWKFISRQAALQHPRLHAVEDLVQLPDGSTTTYLRFLDLADYVTILAIQNGKVAMVYDYAYPLDMQLLQFPEGAIEEDENSDQAARRELQEEAGLLAQDIKVLGKSPGQPRRSDNYQIVVEATDLSETSAAHEATEAGMSRIWLDLDEINAKIATGEIIQKNSLAAWAIYQANRRSA